MNISYRRLFFSQFMFWIVVAGLGFYFLYPLRKAMRFGIDLVGGTYLTLEVKTEKAVETELINKLQSIESTLKRAQKVQLTSKKIENQKIILAFDTLELAQQAGRILKDEKDLIQKIGGTVVTFEFSEQTVRRIKDDSVQRNIEVLRTRLDQFSVAEIPISRQGEKHIVVELPDVADPQKAKDMIGRAAHLEFKLVLKVGSSEEELKLEYDGELPDDVEILPSEDTSEGRRLYYAVQKYAKVTGRMLKDARPALGGKTGVEPVVEFAFNEEGSDKFYELTSKNYGRSLAIVLDSEVISAPTIQAAIRSNGVITGNFTTSQVRTLAHLLKSGSFVAPVTFEEERQVGPSLGEEAIRSGLISCIAGLAILLVFSVFYYKLSGFFAFLALAYNLLLILLGLAWLKATLTLPGIAGMVLTVGMAVDASILIFERVRELIAEGVTPHKAVNAGFAGAMEVILDSNITTFIVGLVLYNFGSGPVQGFAATLMLGIVATLIATLFFMKSLFTFIFNTFSIQKLSI